MIPCLNEEKTLPLVIRSIPRKIKGIDIIKTVVINDGSTDKTDKVAKKLKVDYVINHYKNQGLAKSFSDGLDFCLKKGADIIVNTDGDNQYPQADIPRLIKPILQGKYRIVVADRQTDTIPHFSYTKKLLQKIGSLIVRYVSGVDIPDAVSGYRAYSRKAALQLNIVTDFSYCIETIIQAGKKKIAITSVKVTTNPQTRESRLFKTNFQHIRNSVATIIRVLTMFEPLKVFTILSLILITPGVLVWIRFLLLYFIFNIASGHIQSLIFGTILIVIGFQLFTFGLVADLISANRKINEKILYMLKLKEIKK